jgi:hypothetical protein
MKKLIVISSFLMLFLTTGAMAAAQLGVLPESTISFRGNSTLHHYGATTNALTLVPAIIDASLANGVSAEALKKLVLSKVISNLEVSFPVETLKSGDGGLDDNMYKSLKKDESPVIKFKLTGYDVINANVSPMQVRLKGVLKIANAEKVVALDARVALVGQNVLVTGKKDMLMTDFGIEPPQMFFGAVKTDNEITIRYRIVLGVVKK